MRQGEKVFVDSGAWIALALSRDPLHAQAREQWELLLGCPIWSNPGSTLDAPGLHRLSAASSALCGEAHRGWRFQVRVGDQCVPTNRLASPAVKRPVVG